MRFNYERKEGLKNVTPEKNEGIRSPENGILKKT